MRIRRAFSWFAALAAAVTLFGACSASKEGPSTNKPDPLATPDGFCTKWAENACNDAVVSACSAVDAASCQASQKAFCLSLVPATYSSRFAKECLDFVKQAYTDADLSANELAAVVRLEEPCDRLIKGAGGDGAVCTERSDCNTLENLDCVRKAGDETGTCLVPEIVDPGLECREPQQACTEGFYCNGVNCVGRKALDRDCTSDDECVAEARCSVIDADAGTGTCVARADVRQPCAEDADCKSNICILRSGTDGICVSAVRLSVSESLCDNLS